MAANDEGFDVEIDDLGEFRTKVQTVSDEFRDGGAQAVAALNQFAAHSGLVQSGLASLAHLSTRHFEMLQSAAERLAESTTGLSALAQGASVVAAGYRSLDGAGASALNRIDSDVIEKLFTPPPEQEQAADAGNQPQDPDLQKLADRLEAKFKENKDTLTATNRGAEFMIDSYTGAPVVTVPKQGDLPGTTFVGRNETELIPDLAPMDRYDEHARQESIRDALRPPVVRSK